MKPIGTVDFYYISNEENQFLSRELKWRHLNLQEMLEKNHCDYQFDSAILVLNVGNNDEEIGNIERIATSKKVWVFLYADETFSPRLNFKVLRNPMVKGVIRAYTFPNSNILHILWTTAMNAVEVTHRKESRRFRTLMHLCCLGIGFAIRQKLVKLLHLFFGKSNVDFIPGYTNMFANSLMQKHQNRISCDKSLFELSSKLFPSKRTYSISFVGQRGSSWRRYSILCLTDQVSDKTKTGRIKIVVRNRFGGTMGANNATLETANEYLQVSLESFFIVCPPGNFSYASFRILESILCGSVPLMVTKTSYDPFYRAPFESLKRVNRGSWNEAIVKALNMSEKERGELITGLRLEAQSYFTDKNKEIIQLS